MIIDAGCTYLPVFVLLDDTALLFVSLSLSGLICCIESLLCFEMTFQKELLRLNLMKTMKGMMLQKKKQMKMTIHFLIQGISYRQVLLKVVGLIIGGHRLIQMMMILTLATVRMVVMLP